MIPVTASEDQIHQQLTEAYDIYTQIDGYPKVVEIYLETGQLDTVPLYMLERYSFE